MNVSAILLAGGCSSRMGRDKAELDFHGVTFLQHQVNKLQSLGIRDIVVSGHENAPEGCRFVPDVYPHRGPLSGIHAGLLAIRNPGALVLAVDTPLVPLRLLQELIEAHTAGITVVRSQGKPEPLIGVYDKVMAEACEGMLQGEDSSPQTLLRCVGAAALEYRGERSLLTNCNTPEEYRKILEIEAREHNNERVEKDPV